MDVANLFIPTAGVVGLLSMVTYFFLVVAMFAFLGNSIFALATQAGVHPRHRIAHTLTAVLTALAGLSYYFIQGYYHDMLTGLATVTASSDRQTFIRESYNAIGQYRYMAWFITAPLLFIQLVLTVNVQFRDVRRSLLALLIAALFMFLASYIGHQQLSFDNEIEVSMKATWGLVATIDYVFILFTLSRLWKQISDQTQPSEQRAYRLMALLTVSCWGIYLLGYFLTLVNIDFNWFHLVFTIADIVNYLGVSLILYFTSLKIVDQ